VKYFFTWIVFRISIAILSITTGDAKIVRIRYKIQD